MAKLRADQLITDRGLAESRTRAQALIMFRPEANARRFRQSAERLAMPLLPEELFVESCRALVSAERDWIPTSEGGSLYLRPFMFPQDMPGRAAGRIPQRRAVALGKPVPEMVRKQLGKIGLFAFVWIPLSFSSGPTNPTIQGHHFRPVIEWVIADCRSTPAALISVVVGYWISRPVIRSTISD